MIASPEDARLLFSKWQEEQPPLRIKLLSSPLMFEAVGTVRGFSPAALELRGVSWQFTIPLEDVGITFSDPREIPLASVREFETAKYEFGLALELPNGDRLALMELKAANLPLTREEGDRD
jgi:hypothetical protein